MKKTRIVICGAGIAGVATAYQLAAVYRERDIVLVDRQQPLSLTTSRSGENFRDYWPQACMQGLARRSIELMETLAARYDDAFSLKFSGYDFVSEEPDRELFPSAETAGADPSQRRSWRSDHGPLTDSFPYLSDTIRHVLRFRRAGAFDVHALGSLLLRLARAAGVRRVRAALTDLNPKSGGFELVLDDGESRRRLRTGRLVLAAGPFTGRLAERLDHRLPIQNCLQRKIVIPDPLGAVPRDMPFTIFADPQRLRWSDEEAALIAADPDYRWLLDEFPPGLHVKPEAGGQVKLGWAYNRKAEEPAWEHDDDFDFPNVVIRGASRFMPAFEPYIENPPTPVRQFAGYYTRTPENWPLIGPLGDGGLFVVGALSGFGTMMACAAGELCADWITGRALPEYAGYFSPARYADPALVAAMAALESDGQL